MNLILVGDTHGWFSVLARVASLANPEDVIIQVGDLGYWPEFRKDWDLAEIRRPIHFIDGNHEYHPAFKGISQIAEVWPNLFYIPRGTIQKFGNKTVAFCGGANSIDYKSRTLGRDWFIEEIVGDTDIAKFVNTPKVDILVTHAPPSSMMKATIPPFNLTDWRLSEWYDSSAASIETIWTILGHPDLYCGHLHRVVQWKNARILDINEILTINCD